MAVANDRSALGRLPWLRLSWLGLLGASLVLALAAAVLVQARQYGLLRQAVQSDDDLAALSVSQAEYEYLRLREQWRQAADERQPFDPDALTLRYEIWISRFDLLRAERLHSLIQADAEHRQTLEEIERFIFTADRALGRPAVEPLERPFVAALLPALEALGMPMHSLSLTAAHSVAVLGEQRAQAMRQQNRLGLTLTVFLSC